MEKLVTLNKCVSFGKMGATWKNFHSLKNGVTLKKSVSQLKNGSLKKFTVGKIGHTWKNFYSLKNRSRLKRCVTPGKTGQT